jgi:hypothetical protein
MTTFDYDVWRYGADGPRLFPAGEEFDEARWFATPAEAGYSVKLDPMGNHALTPLGAVEVTIPEDYERLPWFALKSLATKFAAGDPPINKLGAIELIEAELARRGAR